MSFKVRVKVFEADDIQELEIQINEWLERSDWGMFDISKLVYSSALTGNDLDGFPFISYSVVIFYSPKEESLTEPS